VEPVEAADMAKATINSRLPDLDALQLLRSASVTITSGRSPGSAMCFRFATRRKK